MKKIEYVLMILLVSMLVSGCGGSMKRIANIAIWGNPGGNTFISIPLLRRVLYFQLIEVREYGLNVGFLKAIIPKMI